MADSKNLVTLKNLTADEFARVGGFFGGPTVTIYVGREPTIKKYILTKTILCNVSDFFKAAFEGNFKEGHDQIMHLSEDSPDNFELLIQWIYTGNVVLPPNKNIADANANKVILQQQQDIVSRYLSFLTFCHKLLLPQPCDEAMAQMRIVLSENRQALHPSHVRTAIKLPRGHAVRMLFAEAAAVHYMDEAHKPKAVYWLAKEVEELSDFAADLLLVCGETWHSFSCSSSRGTSVATVSFKDPLTKTTCDAAVVGYRGISLVPGLTKR